MNCVQLIGRLTRDPDADHTASGRAVTTLRLAVDRPGGQGADFVTVKTWERVAEATAKHLARGRRVAVQGRLAHEEWVAADRRRAERLTVVADRVEFLDAPAAAPDAAEAPSTPVGRSEFREAHRGLFHSVPKISPKGLVTVRRVLSLIE